MTDIEWARNPDGSKGRTWNPIVGCSVFSPGCKRCYAMRLAARLEAIGIDRYAGLTEPSKAGPVWTGEGTAHGGGITGHERLDWVIVGGESGPGARPMHPDWARSIRDDCEQAGVPFFFKQWGEWAPKSACPSAWPDGSIGLGYDVMHHRSPEGEGRNDVHRVGKKRAGRLLDGRLHDAMPEVRA